jgi:2Fe-2S ferredoxin
VPSIVFINIDRTATTITAPIGITAMEAARSNGVRGIKAECGGECSCSTCHCYVAEEWLPRLPPKTDDEASLLEFAWEPKPTSRLTCQIRITEALDGLVLHVPERQL